MDAAELSPAQTLPPVTVEDARAATVVVLHGEVDFYDQGMLDAAIEQAIERRVAVVVDLCGCDFIDSSALGSLARARRRAREAGVLLAVASTPGSPPAVVLRMTLASVLDVHPDRAAALRAVRHLA